MLPLRINFAEIMIYKAQCNELLGIKMPQYTTVNFVKY